jgi:hypothetical protein
MTSFRNLSKHLKNCYQTKTNREMSQHDFQFFGNLRKSLKVVEYSLFIFIFHICSNFQTQKQKTHCDMYILNVFNYIVKFWKNIWIFALLGVVTIFGEGSFMFNFVGYGLVTKSFGAGCTFENVINFFFKKSKDECESFYNQINMNHLT